jgi:hypothetical protein
MLGLGLKQVQDSLNRKADQIQREFVELSEKVDRLNIELLQLEGEGRKSALEQQREMRARQQEIAEDINLWRERARAVTSTAGSISLRALLEELSEVDDGDVKASVARALHMLDSPEDAQQMLGESDREREAETPVGRLLRRARTEYDLRASDPAHRLRASAEFANRPGIAQDEGALAELEAAQEDPDPLVRELIAQTIVQLYRFRAMRMADLDQSHEAVQALARMQEPTVVRVLAEVVQEPRTGFTVDDDGEAVEASNGRSRLIALLRLVEWHTPEAQAAVRAVRYDKDEEIARAAQKALEVFPDIWTGPLKKDDRR